MMIRNVVVLMGISFCLLSANASAVDAAAKAEGKKPKTLTLSENKARHPCARKSAATLNKKAAPFLESIRTYSKKYNVDHELIQSVITIESCYKQTALSPKGAQGLMQLIPATAKRFGISNAYDADQNVQGGTKYLSWLNKRFKGDLQKVLAGYNAGEGRVDQYGGIPPFRETRHYVHDVLLVYNKLKGLKPQLVKTIMAKEVAKTQAQLDREYKKQRLARQQQTRLAEQKRLAAMTPAQRQRAIRQAQLVQRMRQRQQPDRQKQLVAQMRQRRQPDRQKQLVAQMRQRQLAERQKQLVQRVRQQEKRRAILSGEQSSQTHHIITGQMSRPIRVPPGSQAPVLRKASNKVVRNAVAVQATPKKAPERVRRTYTSPFKPGRGGRAVNKRLAPQLYKQ